MTSSSVDSASTKPGQYSSRLAASRARERHGYLTGRSRCGRDDGARAALDLASCCSAWASTQSRIICCSVRMCWTRPWMPSARLAMACGRGALAGRPRLTAVVQLVRWRCDQRRATRGRRRRRASSVPPGSRSVTVDEPVLELVVEAVLRLAGLQVEEAEDQRAGEAEQRGRERRCPCRSSGAARPLFSSSNIAPASAADAIESWMTLPTEPTVSIRPQKVPSRPRKTSRPAR